MIILVWFYMFALYFYCGPAFCGGIATLVALCTILIVMCKRAMTQEQGFGTQSIYQQGVKEILPLILYPLIYLLLLTPTRIYDAIPIEQWTKQNWLVYHIITVSTRFGSQACITPQSARIMFWGTPTSPPPPTRRSISQL